MLRKTRLVLCLGVLVGAGWAGTFATFTDEGIARSTFTAGTVDLLVDGEGDDDYAFTAIEMSNMKPGDVKYAPLTIENDGTLAFTYTMATSISDDLSDLADQLTLGIKVVASTAACDAAGYTASATTATVSGLLSAAAIASRPLAAGTSEVLCYRVELPSTVDNTFQGATATAAFTFTATQS